MKHFLLTLALFAIHTNVASAQYSFKYNSKIIPVEADKIQQKKLVKYSRSNTSLTNSTTNSIAKEYVLHEVSSANEKDVIYTSEVYSINGQHCTILPNVSITLNNPIYFHEIETEFKDELIFKEKVGKIYHFSCKGMTNSQQVLNIITALSHKPYVLDCEPEYTIELSKNSLKVYNIKTVYNMNFALLDNMLNINIFKDNDIDSNKEIVLYQTQELENTNWSIKIYNVDTGLVVDYGETANNNCIFNTSTWDKGTYLIQARNGKQNITKKIVIK